MGDDETWVCFGEGPGFVALKSTRPPETFFPAAVRFRAGQIEGELSTELSGVSSFVDELSRLYNDLKGQAEISSMEDQLEFVLKADARGKIAAQARITQRIEGAVDYALTFNFQIDQSYLPAIISGLRKQFLAAPQ